MRLPIAVRVAFMVVFAIAATGAVSEQSVNAWCNLYISKWSNPTQTLQVFQEIPTSWHSAINSSRQAWNGIDTLYYAPPNFSPGLAQWFNLFYVDFSAAGYADNPGVTFNNGNYSPHSVSNVYLNSDFTWNTTGVMDQATRKTDVRTVATHELGHSAGLAHPQLCGQLSNDETHSVMYANWTKKWSTNIDDQRGIQALYP